MDRDRTRNERELTDEERQREEWQRREDARRHQSQLQGVTPGSSLPDLDMHIGQPGPSGGQLPLGGSTLPSQAGGTALGAGAGAGMSLTRPQEDDDGNGVSAEKPQDERKRKGPRHLA
jgi:hypothetical protein